MANNYSSWSVDKLNKEIQKIQKIIQTRESRDKKATLAKLVSVARKSGFELHELVDAASVKKASTARKASSAVNKTKRRDKVAPKYRNPANDTETWTGRGRQPLWVKTLVQGGGSLDDVTIGG